MSIVLYMLHALCLTSSHTWEAYYCFRKFLENFKQVSVFQSLFLWSWTFWNGKYSQNKLYRINPGTFSDRCVDLQQVIKHTDSMFQIKCYKNVFALFLKTNIWIVIKKKKKKKKKKWFQIPNSFFFFFFLHYDIVLPPVNRTEYDISSYFSTTLRTFKISKIRSKKHTPVFTIFYWGIRKHALHRLTGLLT